MSLGHWRLLTREDAFQLILYYIMLFLLEQIPWLVVEDIILGSVKNTSEFQT